MSDERMIRESSAIQGGISVTAEASNNGAATVSPVDTRNANPLFLRLFELSRRHEYGVYAQ